MQICINVFLKDGVLDPQAATIHKALHALNFSQVKSVKMSKEIILNLDINDEKEAKNLAQQMCEKLLVNSVIEDYELKFDKNKI